MSGGHQTWCGLFGEKVGWNDELIHTIEPFVMAFTQRLADELSAPVRNAEWGRYESMTRRTLRAEAREAEAEARNAALLIRARVAEDALRPSADFAKVLEEGLEEGTHSDGIMWLCSGRAITVGNFRAAAAVLSNSVGDAS